MRQLTNTRSQGQSLLRVDRWCSAFLSNKLLAVLVLATSFICLNNVAEADFFSFVEVANTVYDASKAVDDASKPLDLYSKTIDALLQHEHPPKPHAPYRFADIADNLTAEAKAVTLLPPQPVFDPKPYQVSFDNLSHCRTQRTSIAKLNQFATDMEAAVTAGRKTSLDLANFQKAIEIDRDLADDLEKAAAEATALPDIGDYFVDQWWEINADLSPALGELSSAVKDKKKSVDDNTSALATAASNLRGNLAVITGGVCLLAGSWSGTCVTEVTGYTIQMQMALSASPGQDGVLSAPGALPDQTMVMSSAKITGYIGLTADLNLTAHPPNPHYRISVMFNDVYTSASARLIYLLGGAGHPVNCQFSGVPAAFRATLEKPYVDALGN